MYVADVLKIAEQRCVTLEEESRSLREAKKEADERLKYVRKQKQIVEGENERLRAQLTGGRPTNAISIETAQRQSDKGKKINLIGSFGAQRHVSLQKREKSGFIAPEHCHGCL